MFKGDSKKADNPDRLNRLVPGSEIIGDIVTNSNLRVDGVIKGNLNCNGRFVLGKEGKVTGNITAIEIEIDGAVEGDIHAKELLTLHKTASIKGDMETMRLVIEDGAQIDGNIQMTETSTTSSKDSKKKGNNSFSKEVSEADIVY